MADGRPATAEARFPSVGRCFEVRIHPCDERLILHVRDVTSRCQAESALRESEERFRVVADAISEVLWVFDVASRRLVYLSPAWERVFGVPRDPVLADPWKFVDIIHPADRERVMAAFRARAAAPQELEYRIVRPDGGVRWLEARVFPVHTPDGAIGRVVGTALDVTRRKRAEQALQASEERFQLAAHAATDVIWDYDIPADSLSWSESFPRLFGYDPATPDSTAATWQQRIHPEDRERVVDAFHDALARRDPFWSAEYRLRRADGIYAHIMDRARLLYDDAGRPVRAVGSFVDVTPQREAEARQRLFADAARLLASPLSAEERLERLAHLVVPTFADFAIVDIVDDSGEIRRVEAVHADPDRAGLVRELLRFPPVGEPEAGVARAIRTGRPVSRTQLGDEQYRAMARSPDHLRVLRALHPRSDLSVPLIARGRSVGALTLVSTTSPDRYGLAEATLIEELARRAALLVENAQLYEREMRLRIAAEAASRAKSDFLSIINHEFRTPLAAIVGYGELLQSPDAGSLSPTQKRYLERLLDSTARLRERVEEILAFARADAGAEPVHLETADAGALTRDAAASLAPLAAAKGLTLDVHTPTEPLLFETDSSKVAQILANLLMNAIKFTKQGGISMTTTRDNDAILFRVSDTGPGIAPEHHERIFEPFWQTDSGPTRGAGGTGLGLAIARRYATLLGGTVTVESEPGQGSTFTLRLPAGQ